MFSNKCQCGRLLKRYEACSQLGCNEYFVCERCLLNTENCRCNLVDQNI